MKQSISLLGLGSLLCVGFASALLAGAPPEFGFEQNRGQAPPEVAYLTRMRGAQVFFTDREVVFAPYEGEAVRLRFRGATTMRWGPDGALQDHISYRVGNEPSRWVDAAPVYGRIVWRGAYPGVDIAFYRNAGQLEYDLLLAPNADARQVRIEWTGARQQADGAIAAGAIRQRAPRLYQVDASGERRSVTGRFVPARAAGEFRLELGEFDHELPLVVDPVLEAASYVGGEGDDEVVAVGLGYLVGNTRSIIFPGVSPARRRTRDIFFRGTGRIGLSGNSIRFTGTMITGGSGDDEATGAGIQTLGFPEVLVVGATDSRDWASLSYRGGSSDGFITAFSMGQSIFAPQLSLGVVTSYGGSGADRLNAIACIPYACGAVGTTDSPDLAGAAGAPQPTLAGGRDAFYVLADRTTGYFGGSGDDQGLAVGVGLDRFVIGGATSSRDLPYRAESSPGWAGGATDAFLAEPALLFPGTLPTFTPRSWYLGGGGADSITALSCIDASPAEPATPVPQDIRPGCGFAGVTDSTDLPVRRAAQAALAGGTDVFAGKLDPPTNEISWLTYWGGSQDDSARAVALNWAGDLFVAGATRSPDLPLIDQQQRYAAGLDGLLAVFTSDGAVRQSSYYGGSGDDRLFGVGLLANNVARWVGATDSTDLPETLPTQARGGGQDGFYVDLGSRYLVGPELLTLPKDGSFTPTLRASGEASVPLTYRTSDPARLRLGLVNRVGNEFTVSAETGVRLEALASEGEVDVTVTSPGYASKTIRVSLVPGVLVVSGLPLIASAWADRPYLLSANVWPVNAAGERTGTPFFVRSGFGAPIRFSSSNPEVLRIAEGRPEAFVARPGRAVVRWEAGGMQSLPYEVQVAAPEPVLPQITVGENLTRSVIFSFALNGATTVSRGVYTARTADPSRLLLLAGRGRPRESVTFAGGAPLTLIGLANSGSVGLVLTSSEWQGERVFPIQLEPTVARVLLPVTNAALPGSLRVGGSADLEVAYQSASGRHIGGSLRPDAPPARFRLENSDPRVLEVSRFTMVLASGSNRQNVNLRALEPGMATLRLRALDWLQLSTSELNVPVIAVASEGTTLVVPRSLIAGRDMQVPVVFRFFSLPQAAATITTDDPNLAVISPSSAAAGSGRTEVLPRSSSDEYSFWIQGLRAEGETTIRIRIGSVEREIRLTLVPSTLGFYPRESEGSEQGRRIRAGLVALDELTLAPIGQGSPRPGVRIPVNVRVEGGPADVSPTTGAIDAQNPQLIINFTNLRGPTSLILDTPPGYPDAPLAARTTLSTSVATLAAAAILPSNPGFLSMPANSVAPLQLPSTQTGLLTVRSLDAERLLISATPTSTPWASIEINGGSARVVYLHGQSKAGLTRLRMESGDWVPAETIVNVFRPSLLLSVGDSSDLAPAQEVSARLALMTGPGLPQAALAPGAAPIRIGLRSSNPGVLTVPAEAVLAPGQSQVTFNIRTGTVGSAELSFDPPDGVDVFPTLVAVNVRSASLVAPAGQRVALGRNAQIPGRFSYPRAFSSAATARITSADPSKLVVSLSASTAGSGSISVPVQPGSNAIEGFFLQALGGDGEVNVTVSVEGYADGTTTVLLRPSYLLTGLASVDEPGSIPAIPTFGLPISVAAVFEPLHTTLEVARLRPGVEPIRFRLRAEPANVVRNFAGVD